MTQTAPKVVPIITRQPWRPSDRKLRWPFFEVASRARETVAMPDTSKVVILGAIAAALSVGAAQFALGHDLAVGPLGAASTTTNSVNRSAKADRAPALPAIGQTKTISLHLSEFADTSFLLRFPAAPDPAEAVRNTTGTAASSSQSVIKSEGIKRREAERPIACELSVSIVTEIAKSLQPGRCMT